MVDATGPVSPDKWGTLSPSASNAAPAQQTTTLPYSASPLHAYPEQTDAPPGQALYLTPNQYQPTVSAPSPPVAGSGYGAPPRLPKASWPPSLSYGTVPMQGAQYTPYPHQPDQLQA